MSAVDILEARVFFDTDLAVLHQPFANKIPRHRLPISLVTVRFARKLHDNVNQSKLAMDNVDALDALPHIHEVGSGICTKSG